jgi:hypothetical protein
MVQFGTNFEQQRGTNAIIAAQRVHGNGGQATFLLLDGLTLRDGKFQRGNNSASAALFLEDLGDIFIINQYMNTLEYSAAEKIDALLKTLFTAASEATNKKRVLLFVVRETAATYNLQDYTTTVDDKVQEHWKKNCPAKSFDDFFTLEVVLLPPHLSDTPEAQSTIDRIKTLTGE